MSENQNQAPKQEAPRETSIAGIPLASVLSIGAGLFGKILEASPLGIAASGVAGLIGFFIIRSLIKRFNAAIDKRDDGNAGGMVGEGAVDLRNQAHQVSSSLDAAQAANPPKKETKP